MLARLIRNTGVVGATAAGLLLTTLDRHLSCPQIEVLSEGLCWVILYLAFNSGFVTYLAVGGPNLSLSPKSRPSHASSISLWIVAFCIATTCCYRSELGNIVFFPLTTPLLLTFNNRFRGPKFQLNDTNSTSSWTHTTLGAFLISTIAIICSFDGNFEHAAISCAPTVTSLMLYFVLEQKTDQSSRILSSFDIEIDIFSSSTRVIVLLCAIFGIQTLLYGISSFHITSILLSSLVRALAYYSIIYVVRCTSWLTATTIGVFGINTSLPSTQLSGLQAVLNLVTCSLALAQTIHLLPRHIGAKWFLWLIILVPFAPFSMNIFAIQYSKFMAPNWNDFEHPVEQLMRNGEVQFSDRIQQQSRNYTAAVTEYNRRYGIFPPPGFDEWYKFATTNQSPIIDDFDMIHEVMKPLLEHSGAQIRQAMEQLQEASIHDLWSCNITGREAKCAHRWRSDDRHVRLLLNNVLSNITTNVPNVQFVVNHLDEPTVLFSTTSRSTEQDQQNPKMEVIDLSQQPTAGALSKFCSKDVEAEKQKILAGTYGLPFVMNRTSAIDICNHPEYTGMHGIFMSPTSLHLTEGIVPILSTGKLSTMGDTLFPSPAYLESEYRYNEATDTDWEHKRNNLFWAGSTTGGFSRIEGVSRNSHRQRFVSMIQQLNLKKKYVYLHEIDSQITRVPSSFLNGRLYDVSFTKIFQCSPAQCRSQRQRFRTKSRFDKDFALKSRLVFDLDGNGISGRFYKLLSSKSLPLKQTLFREWHDERLMPWVHYVPVSQEMEELPELVFWLTSTERGRIKAKEVAEQGREWFGRAFRDVDISIYMYRLFLELARLQDEERQPIVV